MVGLPLVLLGWEGLAAAVRFFGLYVLFSFINPYLAIFPALILAFWDKMTIYGAVGWSLFLKALGIKLLAVWFMSCVVLGIGALLLDREWSHITMADLIFWFSLSWAGGLIGIALLVAMLLLKTPSIPWFLILVVPYFPILVKVMV